MIAGRYYGKRGGAVRVLLGRANLTDVRMEDNWAEKGGGALRVGNGSSATCQIQVPVRRQPQPDRRRYLGRRRRQQLGAGEQHGPTTRPIRAAVCSSSTAAPRSPGQPFPTTPPHEGADILSVDAELTMTTLRLHERTRLGPQVSSLHRHRARRFPLGGRFSCPANASSAWATIRVQTVAPSG